MTNNNFPSTWVILSRTQNNWHNAPVKDPKTIGTMAVQKVMIFCFVFYQHFREISKVAVPNFHNKDIT